MIRLRPLVALSRSAPVPQQVARLIELKDRRGRAAALGDGRIEFEPSFVVVQPPRAAMNDPDVVLLIDPHSDGPAEQPVIRQRLRPQRVDLEHRCLDCAPLGVRLVLQHGLADAERDDKCSQGCADKKVTFSRCAFHGFPRFESELRCHN